MRYRILTAAAVALAAGLGLGASAASAAEATTTVNVRSGPGTQYGVVDVLRAGEWVDIERQRGGWCYVSKPGPNGWVSCRYLTDDYYERPRRPRVNVEVRVPGVWYGTPRPPRPPIYAPRPPAPPVFPGPGPRPGFPPPPPPNSPPFF